MGLDIFRMSIGFSLNRMLAARSGGTGMSLWLVFGASDFLRRMVNARAMDDIFKVVCNQNPIRNRAISLRIDLRRSVVRV